MPTPNILLILSDDHGYGDVSCHGGPNIHTPNIDAIAGEGVRFSQFYANSPVCSPSRAALMTGCFPDRVGVPGVIRTHPENSWGYFAPGATTLPEVLARAGYHSTLVGKWHLGLEPENHPCERGFDVFRGFLGDMMDDYYTHRRWEHNYMRHNHQVIDPRGHATDIFTDYAIETLEQRAAAANPFFLLLAYNAPHTPIQPPDEWVEAVQKREPGVSEQRAKYIALVEHMDAGIGRVREALRRTGLDQDTLLVYVSDNGGQLDVGACNGPLRGAKQEMYEGGIRVPCCAAWPAHIPPRTVSHQPAMLMDLFPTVCEAAGAAPPDDIDAQSILPTMLGEEQDFGERTYYWVRREGGRWGERAYFGKDYHAVRRGNLKLLQNDAFSPAELYDLGNDPDENNDRSTSDNATRKNLAHLMQHHLHRAGRVPWQKPRPECPDS